MKRIILKNVNKTFKVGFERNQSALGRFTSYFSGREPKRSLKVLRDVTLEARSGEIIGLIGSNGSGKSTLLRTIAGIYHPDSGYLATQGHIVSLIGFALGLKDRLSMRDNIILIGTFFGLTRKEIKARMPAIIRFADLTAFEHTKIYQCSSGMLQRLAFSIVVHCDPEVLLLDEVFEVGDEDFRRKCTKEVIHWAKKGATVMLVSHELDMVEKYCQRVLWMDEGEILKDGEPQEVVREYLKYNVQLSGDPIGKR